MNYEQALPYLQKALEKGRRHLRSDHPYMATTYYYFGLYYYKKQLADKSLKNLNDAGLPSSLLLTLIAAPCVYMTAGIMVNKVAGFKKNFIQKKAEPYHNRLEQVPGL